MADLGSSRVFGDLTVTGSIVNSELQTALNSKSNTGHTHTLSEVTDAGNIAGISTNGSTANYLRGDGKWVTPPNTTYGSMSQAEANAGTVTTGRVITAAVLKGAIQTHAPIQTTITGNAGTATTLQTARTINGTSFNGSANITTANWGTGRTLTIGNKGKTVNGSANVSWTLAEIGASAEGHTHDYVPTSRTVNGKVLSANIALTATDVGAAAASHTHSYLSTLHLSERGIADANLAQDAGVTTYYLSSAAANKPAGQDHSLLTLSYSTGWSTQLAGDWRTNEWYVRKQTDGVWDTSWAKLWHSGNFDPVSKSDVGHTHAYLPLSGGTLTNALLISVNKGATPNYSTGHLELRNSDAGDVSLGFHRAGYTACQLRHESNGLILSGTSPTTAADFYCYGSITAYSDLRLKKDLKIIESPIDKVMRLNGYTYVRTNDVSEARQTGVVAQEVLEVLPEAVTGGPTENDPDGHYSVAYGNMVGLLIEAIKELKAEVDELKRRVE